MTLRLSLDGSLTHQPMGEESREVDYPHERRGFAGDCVLATQRHFIDRLRNGQSFETSGQEYLRTLDVEEAVYRAAETGLPQEVFSR